MKTNVIGYKDNRKYLWGYMLGLRQAIASDKDKPQYREAYLKELYLYRSYLNEYIN